MVISRIKDYNAIVTPLKLQCEVEMFTRTENMLGVAFMDEKGVRRGKHTRATPPATIMPRAETPFMEAAPVA